MTKDDKIAFVNNLCNAVRDSVIANMDALPEAWDGHELRRFLADKFEHEAWTLGPRAKDARRRFRDYRNAVAILPRI